MFYLVLLTSILLLSLIKSRTERKSLIDIIIIVLMTVIYGIRYDVGIDYLNYETQYYDTTGFYGQREFLYEQIMQPFKFFNAPFWIFSLFVGFIIFFTLYRTAKNLNVNYDVIIIFFILTGMLFVSFNLVRQIIATVIILYAFTYISKNSFLKYCLFIILASLFHFSAIIFIPFYFITQLRFDMKIHLIFLGAGLFLYFTNIFNRFGTFLVPDKYIHLLGGRFDYKLDIGLGVLFFIFIAIYISINKVGKMSPYFPYYYLYTLGYSLFLFSLNSFIMSRLNIYSQMGLIVVLTTLIKPSQENKLYKFINIAIVINFLILFLMKIHNIYDLDSNNLLYNTVFTN